MSRKIKFNLYGFQAVIFLNLVHKEILDLLAMNRVYRNALLLKTVEGYCVKNPL